MIPALLTVATGTTPQIGAAVTDSGDPFAALFAALTPVDVALADSAALTPAPVETEQKNTERVEPLAAPQDLLALIAPAVLAGVVLPSDEGQLAATPLPAESDALDRQDWPTADLAPQLAEMPFAQHPGQLAHGGRPSPTLPQHAGSPLMPPTNGIIFSPAAPPSRQAPDEPIIASDAQPPAKQAHKSDLLSPIIARVHASRLVPVRENGREQVPLPVDQSIASQAPTRETPTIASNREQFSTIMAAPQPAAPVAPAAPTGPDPAAATAQRLAGQIAAAMPRLRHAGGEAVLTLDPARLGRVTLSWQASNAGPSVLTVRAVEPATAALLNRLGDDITAILRAETTIAGVAPSDMRLDIGRSDRAQEPRLGEAGSLAAQRDPTSDAMASRQQHRAPPHTPDTHTQVSRRAAVNPDESVDAAAPRPSRADGSPRLA